MDNVCPRLFFSMGFFSNLLEGLGRLFFGNIQLKKYNCDNLVVNLNNFPQSLPDYCQKEISRICGLVEYSYANANSKEFSIAIVGDFSVGKSSFVNALLSREIVPVSAKPCTAAITRIVYGRKDHVVLCHDTLEEKILNIEQYKQFSSYSISDLKELEETGTLSRFKGINKCTIYTSSSILKNNNLCIIDTLGLSANENDTNKTLEAIKGAVAIIYLCAERGLTEPDCSFISKHLHPENPNFFLCLNRKDLLKKSEQQDVVLHIKLKMDSLIKEINSSSHDSYPEDRLFAVSSLYQNFANGFETDSEDYNPNVNYSEKSGFNELLSTITEYVNTNSEEARLQYLNNQMVSVRESILSLKNVREQEIEYNIVQLQKVIAELSQRKEDISTQINIIEMKFDKILGKLNLRTDGLKGRCVGKIESTWEENIRNVKSKVHFTKGDYLKLCGYKMNIFLSESTKKEKACEVLKPFCNVIIEHIEQQLVAIIKDELDFIGNLGTELYRAERIELPNSGITTYTLANPTLFNDRQRKSISDSIWNQLTRNGVFFSSALALLEWCLGMSTSDSQIIEMISGTKETVIREINVVLDYISSSLKNAIVNTNDAGKTRDTEALYTEIDRITKEIQKNELKRESLHDILNDENIYFDTTLKTLKL